MRFSVELPRFPGSTTGSYDLVAAARKASPAGANFDRLANGIYVSRPSFAELAAQPPAVAPPGGRTFTSRLGAAQFGARDASSGPQLSAISRPDLDDVVEQRATLRLPGSSHALADVTANDGTDPGHGATVRPTSVHGVSARTGIAGRIGSWLHRMFVGIHNPFRRTPEPRIDHRVPSSPASPASKAVLHAPSPMERGRDHLVSAIPTLQRLLQHQDTYKPWNFEQLPALFRELERGVSTFATLAQQGAREGIVSHELARWMGRNDGTAPQFRARIGDGRALADPHFRDQLRTYIADVRYAVLEYASETGQDDLAKQLDLAWRPIGGRPAPEGPASPRLYAALPRLMSLLDRPDLDFLADPRSFHVTYQDFRTDLIHVADGLDELAWNATVDDKVPYAVASALTTLASPPVAGTGNAVAPHLWEKLRSPHGQPGDPAFFSRPQVRAALREYLGRIGNAVSAYADATGNRGLEPARQLDLHDGTIDDRGSTTKPKRRLQTEV